MLIILRPVADGFKPRFHPGVARMGKHDPWSKGQGWTQLNDALLPSRGTTSRVVRALSMPVVFCPIAITLLAVGDLINPPSEFAKPV